MADVVTADLMLFAVATFAGAIVAGIAGFAFGLVSSAIWLHVITPQQSAVLIPAFAVVVQSISTWKLRHAVKPARMWPFIVGGAVGIPIGAEILRYASPPAMRTGLGVFLVAFSIYAWLSPRLGPVYSNRAIDGFVGVVSGVVGSLTGLAGLPVNIWTTMRGWPKDEQRAVFQPVAVVLFILTLAWFGAAGIIPEGTLKLFLVGLPLVPLGTWIGLKLYGRLDEKGFRRVVLGLLFVSGLTLLPSAF